MELSITTKGILVLKGTPSKQYEFLILNSSEVIEIDRTDESYWESEEPVKDGHYIYVETDTPTLENLEDVDADSDETELFTIINLRNCLLEYEKKIVSEGLVNCTSGSVCKGTSDRQIADFLLATVFVVENLVCKGHYSDAAEIVEKVHGCNGICKQTSKTKKCNCC